MWDLGNADKMSVSEVTLYQEAKGGYYSFDNRIDHKMQKKVKLRSIIKLEICYYEYKNGK